MRTLLINIALRPDSPRYILPVGLGYIATSLSRNKIKFDLLDLDQLRPTTTEKLTELICENTYDIYMMGCIVTGYRHVKQISPAEKTAMSASVFFKRWSGIELATELPTTISAFGL